MKDGVRVINVARGGLLVEEALKDAIDSGKVAGAALDVFPEEPVTEHPLFSYPNVVVTPHLGASTAEATDRAGYQAAEQVAAALSGGVVTSAVNVPAVAAEDVEALGPFLPLCASSAASRRAGRGPLGRPARGRVPRPRRRAGHAAAHGAGPEGRALRPHRGAGERRERLGDCDRAWHRGRRDQAGPRARLHGSRAGGRRQRRLAQPRGRHRLRHAATGRTCSRPGARASTSSSRTTSWSSATATNRG